MAVLMDPRQSPQAGWVLLRSGSGGGLGDNGGRGTGEAAKGHGGAPFSGLLPHHSGLGCSRYLGLVAWSLP